MNTEERELEARLRRLVPSPHHLQRDRLMFRAGQQAAQRQSIPWRAVSAVLFVGCVVFGLQTIDVQERPEAFPVVQVEPAVQTASPELVAGTPAPTTVGDRRPTHPSEYHRLRDLVLMNGADALPHPPASPVQDSIEASMDWPPEMRSGLPHSRRAHARSHGDPS
jgi:hypothetical protein